MNPGTERAFAIVSTSCLPGGCPAMDLSRFLRKDFRGFCNRDLIRFVSGVRLRGGIPDLTGYRSVHSEIGTGQGRHPLQPGVNPGIEVEAAGGAD